MFLFDLIFYHYLFPFIWSRFPRSCWFKRPIGTTLNTLMTLLSEALLTTGLFLWTRPIKLQYNRLTLIVSSALIISIIKEFTRVCLPVFMGVHKGNTEVFFSIRDFLNFTFSSGQFHFLLCSGFSDSLLQPNPTNAISKWYSEDFIKMQITHSICL